MVRLLDDARKQSGASLKDVVNEALRMGLQLRAAPRLARKRHVTKSVSLDVPLVRDIDDIGELLQRPRASANHDPRGREHPRVRIRPGLRAARGGTILARRTAPWHGSGGAALADLLALLRLVTNPRVFSRWASTGDGWRQGEEWLDCEPAWIPAPTDRHRRALGELLAAVPVRANLVPDADLAALALEHGLALASTDGDFARFPGLRLENPLSR